MTDDRHHRHVTVTAQPCEQCIRVAARRQRIEFHDRAPDIDLGDNLSSLTRAQQWTGSEHIDEFDLGQQPGRGALHLLATGFGQRPQGLGLTGLREIQRILGLGMTDHQQLHRILLINAPSRDGFYTRPAL